MAWIVTCTDLAMLEKYRLLHIVQCSVRVVHGAHVMPVYGSALPHRLNDGLFHMRCGGATYSEDEYTV